MVYRSIQQSMREEQQTINNRGPTNCNSYIFLKFISADVGLYTWSEVSVSAARQSITHICLRLVRLVYN